MVVPYLQGWKPELEAQTKQILKGMIAYNWWGTSQVMVVSAGSYRVQAGSYGYIALVGKEQLSLRKFGMTIWVSQ